MDSPLIYLTLCSVRNRLAKRLRRLREPRYLFGSVIGFGYLFLVFGRSYFMQRRYAPPGGRSGLLDALGGSLGGQLGAAATLLLLVALAWTLPSRRAAALAFTRADVQFLFTAPIPRWQLVRYRVLRSQLGAFIGTAIVTLILHPANVFQGWRFFVGFWLVMATINLHTTGITLMRGQAAQRGQLTFLRRWLPTAIAFGYVTLIAIDVVVRWLATPGAAGTPQDALSAAVQVAASGLSGVLLWPFLAIVRLPLADSGLAFMAALPWTLLAIALNYVWVLRTDAPFEEASAELAEKLARVRKEGVKALRDRPRPAVKTPFKLAAVGPSEIAIVWKNLISMGRMVSWTTMIRFGPLLIVLVAFLGRRGGGSGGRADALALVSLFVAAFAMILGPQITRADLRQDLPNLGVLRTWPLRGATIVRGEVLAPAALLVAIAWLALVTAAVVSTQGSLHRQIDGNVWSYLLAAMAVAPGIVLVQLLVQNALAVTFPAWVAVGPPRGGIDVMGQRMLLMTASFLGLALTLLPAALVGGVVLFIVQVMTGRLLIVLPGLLAAIVLLGEAFLGSELLGAVLDRTDVNALEPGES
jgi:hypothetical protein